MHLAELQRAIQTSVFNRDDTAARILQSTAHFDAKARLHVYQHAYVERLIAALAVNYPATQRALGDVGFRELACAYVEQHPPHHFSIRYFGDALDRFIARHSSGPRAHGLSELAHWEWTLATAFDAADRQPLNAATLATIAPDDWPHLRFEFSPCVQRLALTSNAVQWWRALTQQTARPSRWRTAKRREWAVWRQQLKIYFRSLDDAETASLDCARAGCTFEDICTTLARVSRIQDPSMQAAMLLHTWIRDGWIVGASTSPAAPRRPLLEQERCFQSPVTGEG